MKRFKLFKPGTYYNLSTSDGAEKKKTNKQKKEQTKQSKQRLRK